MMSGMLLAGEAASSPAQAVATVASSPIPSDGADGRVNALARVGDRVYIGGDFSSAGGQPRAGLAALDATSGQVITTWRADVNGAVEALAPSSDGATLYVGGEFTTVSGVIRRHVAAVSTSTGGVGAWNPSALGGPVLALATLGGHVYVGGKFTSIGSVERRYLAAVSSSGAMDLGFDAQLDGNVWALKLSPDDGTLYAGGQFHSAAGQTRAHLAALSPASGSPAGWHPRVTCPVLGLDAVSSAVYAACGGGRQLGNSAVAYSPSSGAPLWSAHTDGNVQAVAQLGGAVYIGGHFATVDGVSRKKAAALDADSGQLLPWDPHPDSALGVQTLLADGDSLWMGGDFTTVNGTSQPHVARFR